MNRAQRLGLGLALGVLLVLGGGGGAYLWLAGPGAAYDARGRVAGFGQDGRSLIVEHEAVEGYMEAMTMSFDVKDTTALSGLDVGDAIGFRLHTGAGRSSWITHLERLPDSAVARHPAGKNVPGYARKAATSSTVLAEDDASPGFTLARDLHGDTVRTSNYRGKALLLNFIYTNCPLPDYCPLMSKNFAQVQNRLADSLQSGVQLLSVSFDPENDTPEVLRAYARRYDADTTNWTFATGTKKQVERITNRFGVFTQQEGGQITHNLRTVLIGPKGHIQRIWRGNDWQPQAAGRAVQRVLRASEGTKPRASPSQSS
jgi:protein SCO1/2